MEEDTMSPDEEGTIRKKILTWSKENLKTGKAFVNELADPDSYVSFLKEKWKLGFEETGLKQMLIDQSGLYFASIHYESYNLPYPRRCLLSEVFGETQITSVISELVIGFEKYLLPLQSSEEHIAWMLILNDVNSVVHVRIGPDAKVKNDTELIPFSESVLKFLVENFEICHIDKTMRNIEKGLQTGINVEIRNEILRLCEKLRKRINQSGKDIIPSEEGEIEIVRSIVISFYITLTLLKNEKYHTSNFDKTKSKIFNNYDPFDAVFLPIFYAPSNIVACLASLHHKELSNYDCEAICECYAQFYSQFIEWERKIKELLDWAKTDEISLIKKAHTSLSKIEKLQETDENDIIKKILEENLPIAFDSLKELEGLINSRREKK